MAIALDAVSQGTAVTTLLTFAHTCTGSNPILFVGINCNNSDDRITSVTYNAVAMTKIDGLVNSASNTFLYLFYLLNPATGANNVVITPNQSTNINAISISYTGAKQSAQPDSHGTVSSSVNSAAAQTSSLTSIADNCWMLSYAHGAGDLPSASTNFTSRNTSGNARVGDSNGVIHPAGGLSQSVTNSGAGPESVTMLSVTFSPFVASTANPAFLLNFV